MSTAIFFIIATIMIEAVGGITKEIIGGYITKEQAIDRVTVKLVRKTWRPNGYNPGTDEPLQGFPGNHAELFRIFKNYNHNFGCVAQPLRNATLLFFDPNYNASQPSVLITHPMTIGPSYFVSHVVGVLALRNLQKHYNVFAMHAPWLSWQFQVSCLRVAIGLDPKIKPVAEAFASFLLKGVHLGVIKPYQINFIGFSYSATLNAYIAREIRDNTGFLTHTLMTLDAFQYNKRNRLFKPVSSEDAMYVHMFHSSSKMGGTLDRIGTVDIVLNNGFIQPGCEGTPNAGSGCSHRRSVPVFIFSVLAIGNVVARQCKSWQEFYQCKCNVPTNPMLIVSFPVNEEARGTFYVRTDRKLPFAIGPKGAYCAAEIEKPSIKH